MQDFVMIMPSVGFFVLAWLYTKCCDRLQEKRNMELEYLIGGVLSVLLTGYLVYALLWPERF